MQERLKYSSKDKELIKYGFLFILFEMEVIDGNELIELLEIINKRLV